MWDRVRQLAGYLDAHIDELTALDSVAGDGDLGLTAKKALQAVTSNADVIETQAVTEQLTRIGRILASEVPSTSGTLVAFGFLGAGKADISDGPDAQHLADILTALGTTIATRGKAEPGDKTMLDALIPAADAAQRSAADGSDLDNALSAAAEAAEAGAANTPAMIPKFGRAAWLADRSAGNIDAGARLVAVLLRGLCADRN
ncbi:hypothetical protein BVC93_10325 [Mycobacterium sp. MS1601]|uniref:dihydroxyacetone kinase subunit L n=1 Tax=Mycobacterium sp. MS1601 TaxID=1936029 RepID=UPI0009797E6B|nr:dihydroxyacetone kinase subunit L [Mycobacterium sp. MS1601]AQA06289.1 hypothetical protein BVC93_10325 [Mycobacterium sp. MS1601]